MSSQRLSGLLLHISSLPGPFGVGDFGPGARTFVDFLERTGQRLWQVLPLGPTGYGNSPYSLYSSFAGNPLFISLEDLVESGLLLSSDISAKDPAFALATAQFDEAQAFRAPLLQRAYERFGRGESVYKRSDFESFCHEQRAWLDEFALFMAIKQYHSGQAWTSWPSELVEQRASALAEWSGRFAAVVDFHRFIQFLFFAQWRALKEYSQQRGVQIVGDVPIFVAHDSADVWTRQHLFHLDSRGKATLVAGVPPDYFSATGQLWGNPLYRWDEHRRDQYQWWCERLGHAFRLYDVVRLDHFRGFEAYWEIPGDAATAAVGRWAPGPGHGLFRRLGERFRPLPLIAEDLGLITPEVERLRDDFNLPGMRVLQFAFSDEASALVYRPHSYIRNCVVYTGTHDNDTAVGWFHSPCESPQASIREQAARTRRNALRYMNSDGANIHWDFLRQAWASVADRAIAPMQDILGLGSEARMNTPGTAEGNWRWRVSWPQVTEEVERRLADLTSTYSR